MLCGRSLFLLKNNGALYAVSRVSGRVRWKRKLGDLAASSPACGHGTVYAVLLARGKGVKGGRVVAVDADGPAGRAGRGRSPRRAESSPLLDSGRLYFGSEDGTVYALRASDGAVRWRYKASGAVKGGLALKDGKLFFGDYGGKVQAIRQADGHRLWRSNAARRRARPARRALLLDAGRGVRARLHRQPRRLRLLVRGEQRPARLAPQDRRLRLLLARGGVGRRRRPDRLHRLLRRQALRAERAVGPGPLDAQRPGARSPAARSSSATSSSTRTSRAARRPPSAPAPAQLVWKTDRGAFNPAISDGRRIYLVGYSSLFMLADRDQARRDARVRLRDPVERRRARNRATRARREPPRPGRRPPGARRKRRAGPARGGRASARSRATAGCAASTGRSASAATAARSAACRASSCASRGGRRPDGLPAAQAVARRGRTAIPAAARCALASATR